MEDDPKFDEWIRALDEDVIQGEFGYEPGEFTVYASHWRELYDLGLTPKAAFQRALDGYANARDARDRERKENYARIVAADEAYLARARLDHKQSWGIIYITPLTPSRESSTLRSSARERRK